MSSLTFLSLLAATRRPCPPYSAPGGAWKKSKPPLVLSAGRRQPPAPILVNEPHRLGVLVEMDPSLAGFSGDLEPQGERGDAGSDREASVGGGGVSAVGGSPAGGSTAGGSTAGGAMTGAS